MNFLKNIFGPSQYPVVIVQYERNDYSADNPEQLHWAIIVLSNLKDQRGPCWQTFDRHYQDGSVVWELFDGKSVALANTRKCLGGVCIGSIEAKKLEDISKVISSNQPAVKFQGWNCRDWIMEVVALLKRNGFIDYKIPAAQEGLFQALRIAGHKTLALRETGNNSEVEIVQINE